MLRFVWLLGCVSAWARDEVCDVVTRLKVCEHTRVHACRSFGVAGPDALSVCWEALLIICKW